MPPSTGDEREATEGERSAESTHRCDLDDALDRARAGDPRGFETLFRALGGSLCGYLRARGVNDPDDLTNEVFVRAFKTIHTFRGNGERFRSWLFTIAHHAAIDDRRRWRRRVETTPFDGTEQRAVTDVEEEVISRLARERVDALLGQLSPDQRDVLLLRIVADLSVEQTGAVIGKGYEAVKALQRRGLASLRRLLAAEEGVPR